MKGQKILFIGTRPVWPMKDGRTVLINQYCSILATELHYRVYYACFDLKKEQPPYFSGVYGLKGPGMAEMLYHVLFKSVLSRRWPFQASVMYCRRTQKWLDQIVEQVGPQVIICDMVRTAPYLHKRYGESCRKILDMDDLLSKRYYRQAGQTELDDNVLGQFKKKLPGVVTAALSGLRIMKKLLLFEAHLMERYELQEAKEFDQLFFCSPKDREEFNRKSDRKADCIPTAVDAEYFGGMTGEGGYRKRQIGYLGNIDIAANRDSVMYLARHIMPGLLQKDPDFQLLVVGNCSPDTHSQFEKYPYMKFTFRVEDIRTYVKQCVAVVAPVPYGSGIKIKIIESMAMGVPVVTNRYGIEGLEVIGGREVMVCERDEDYLDAVWRLSEDKCLRNEIGTAGREYVLEKHSMKTCRERLEALLGQ